MSGALVPKQASGREIVRLAERGAALIAEAVTLDEAGDYRAQATAMEVLTRQKQLGEEAAHAATTLRLRAERRIGQLLVDGRKTGTIGTGGRPEKRSSTRTVSLEGLGITKNESASFTKLAELTDDEFNAAVEAQPKPSRASLVNLVESETPKPKSERRAKPTGLRHPARFSEPLLPIFAAALAGYHHMLDPFAGTGLVHRVADEIGCVSVGVEIEPEWAALHPRTIVGNALSLPFDSSTFDAVLTSPTYGNRFADHHDAKDGSERRSYTFDLGRKLHADNSGSLHWGEPYREFHRKAWAEVARVLQPNGRFVLNVSDHVRGGERMPVSPWHFETVLRLGFTFYDLVPVETARLRYGDTAAERPAVEYVAIFERKSL